MLPMGDCAVLLEYASLEETLAAYRGLDAAARPGVVDLVPAARTVLVVVDPRILSPRDAGVWARAVEPVPADAAETPEVVVPARYDGEDLSAAATVAGLSPEALVSRHVATRWTSAFIGFTPGFAYLAAESGGLGMEIPRRTTSRPRVPPGSVALAGPFTGVYPRESPGGWQLIGSTDAVLWDAAAHPPALLPPGTRVRFEAIR